MYTYTNTAGEERGERGERERKGWREGERESNRTGTIQRSIYLMSFLQGGQYNTRNQRIL